MFIGNYSEKQKKTTGSTCKSSVLVRYVIKILSQIITNSYVFITELFRVAAFPEWCV